MARSMKHQTALWLGRLGRHEPHVGLVTHKSPQRRVVLLLLDGGGFT